MNNILYQKLSTEKKNAIWMLCSEKKENLDVSSNKQESYVLEAKTA